MKVLHVDDDPSFLKVAKQCLEMQGEFQVETASSVEEAIKKMKKKRYDAIVSDYQMPERDGLQFLEELRKRGNNIPFIMFTRKGREEIAVKRALINLVVTFLTARYNVDCTAEEFLDCLPRTVNCQHGN